MHMHDWCWKSFISAFRFDDHVYAKVQRAVPLLGCCAEGFYGKSQYTARTDHIWLQDNHPLLVLVRLADVG